MKFWRISHHIVIDSRQSCDEIRYSTLWIHQRSKFIDDVRSIKLKNADFRNLIALDAVPRRLYVYDAIIDNLRF